MNNQLKPQDLRYGNLIESQGKIFTVKAIEAFIVTATRGKGNVEFTYAEVNPIPLTEEILLMAGFEKHIRKYKQISNVVYYINDFEIQIHGDRFPLSINGGESAPYLTQYFAHHTKYLHRLQNLYFAITSEELKINLK